MRFAKTFLVAAGVSFALGNPVAAGTIFVKAGASGANDGTSWTDAYTDLQAALAASTSGDEIWVAAGTYKPTATTTRTISFALKNGVGVYGGFVGTETMRSERNPAANVTTLSGDIGTVGVTTDNSYHVVTSDGTVTATGILDGFTVTGGRADGPTGGDPTGRGAGAFVDGGSAAFVRCTFTNGYASDRGGGVRVVSGSPSFTDCTFQGNFGQLAGGGLSAGSVTSVVVRSCVFRSNSVGNSTGGGGIEATDNFSVQNSVLAQNSPNGANFFGGGNIFINTTLANNASYGIAFFANPNTIVNSIVYNNPTGAIFLGISGIVTVSYSDVQGGWGGTGNTGANPLFLNAPSDLRLGAGSPAVDAGNNAPILALPNPPVTTDIAGLPRFFDDPGAANVGAGTPPIVDMGAYERVPLTVSAPAPASQTVCAGASVSFSVTASGSPSLTYRWRKGGADLFDGGAISGAATATLTIDPTATGNSGSYDVVVTDGFGQPLTSSAATLTVNAIPSTPVAGNNGPICTGQTLQLTASTIASAAYSWTGPNGFASSQQNPSIPSATLAAAGGYSVTATVNACTSAAGMTNVVVNSTPSAVISAPAAVCPDSGGFAASVPDAGVGATYSWSITNGTITGGAGTRSITFSSGSSGTVMLGITVQTG
ncbi:MAG TPA: choice-of-anchor Q domain-containing protein, partial [Thermoanaerobaculia bacterium]|nr:choice-of-anchor Q domain-containing protein [Thermoanaerobaculia bacterium]